MNRRKRPYLDVKVIPARMMEDYQAKLTREQIARKWGIDVNWTRKILEGMGVQWQHPARR
jgi:hypothetical protein